jgi:type IV secretion system protein VirB5
MNNHAYVFRKICASALISISGFANAQIPVTDMASISNNIANQVANIEQYIAQYNMLVTQYSNMESQLKALSGPRGFENLMNNPLTRQLVPADDLNAFQSAVRVAKCADKIGAGAQQQCAVSATQQATKTLQANIQNAIKARQSDIQSMVNNLSTTNDQKATMDLTARISGEQASATVEIANILNAQNQMQAAQLEAAQQAYLKSIEGLDSTVDNSSPFFPE